MKANHRLQVGPGSRVEDYRFYILYEKVMPMYIFGVPGFGCKVYGLDPSSTKADNFTVRLRSRNPDPNPSGDP